MSDAVPAEQIEAVLAEREVREEYIDHLEGEVRELLAAVERRDEYVEKTEAYAAELEGQLLDLEAEIKAKNAYIREKEADSSTLWGEREALRAELDAAREELVRLRETVEWHRASTGRPPGD